MLKCWSNGIGLVSSVSCESGYRWVTAKLLVSWAMCFKYFKITSVRKIFGLKKDEVNVKFTTNMEVT